MDHRGSKRRLFVPFTSRPHHATFPERFHPVGQASHGPAMSAVGKPVAWLIKRNNYGRSRSASRFTAKFSTPKRLKSVILTKPIPRPTVRAARAFGTFTRRSTKTFSRTQ